MHTPDQARKLWCPMVRLAAAHANGDVEGNQSIMNRLQTPTGPATPDASMCIADQCAMWRWGEFKSVTKPEIKCHPADASGNTRTLVHCEHPVGLVGYCGIAGRPV